MRFKETSSQQRIMNKAKKVLGKHLHWVLVAGGLVLSSGAVVMMPDNAEAKRGPADTALQPQQALPLPAIETAPDTAAPAPLDTRRLQGEWKSVTVQSGDSLARLFSREGLTPQELYQATSNEEAAARLKKIFPGDELRLRIHEGKLTELIYEFDLGQSLHLSRNDKQFQSEIITRPLETRTSQASGIINDSLFLSAQAAGLSDKLTMELAGIFGWDVDFALDIRQGDSFTVMYEELYLDGEKVRDGKIIAAEFVNQGKSFQAIYYETKKGEGDYYAPDGRSMRKAFLRTPVAFSRISSRFNLKRKHPVLNKIRAHKGVDYAASRGTPIKATGAGKVIHKGIKGGYGRTVIIQNGSRYTTLFAHMSKYARGIRKGARVKQGQVIGYVGSSGLATGPHLHYEFRVDGSVRNPLTVKLPSAEPLPKAQMQAFAMRSNQLIARLELIKRSSLALASR
ncbi:MAG TPA: peptidase M23 [Candidatus Tenderia sp.]|nr:peptidase M23 [Candidatus Tenderia sp.]